MEQKIIEQLISIGFTEGEAKTYIALVSLGTSTVGPIIGKSGISASKVYQILDRLMHKGLVKMMIQEGNKQFTAADPTVIFSYLEEEQKKIEQNKEKIKEIIPILKLSQKTAEKKPIVEMVIGKKGFETVYNELIDQAKPNSDYYVLAGYKISYKLQSLWYPASLNIGKKNISQIQIYEHKTWYEKDSSIHRRKERKKFYPFVLNQRYDNLPNFILAGDRCIISGLDEQEEVFALLIRNKNLTEAIRKLIIMISDLGKVPEGFNKHE